MATKNPNAEITTKVETPNVETTTQEETDTSKNDRIQSLKTYCNPYFDDYPNVGKFLVIDGEFPEVFLPENEAIAKHSAKQNNRTLYVIAR